MKGPLLQELQRARMNNVPVALVTRLNDGAQCLVYTDEQMSAELSPDSSQIAEVRELLRAARSAMLAGGELFVRSYVPA